MLVSFSSLTYLLSRDIGPQFKLYLMLFKVTTSISHRFKHTKRLDKPEKIDQDISQNITFIEQIKITYPKYFDLTLYSDIFPETEND